MAREVRRGNSRQFFLVLTSAIHRDDVSSQLVKRVALALRRCDFRKLGGNIGTL